MKDAIKVTSHAAAQALNVVASYITDFLGDAGIDGEFILLLFTCYTKFHTSIKWLLSEEIMCCCLLRRMVKMKTLSWLHIFYINCVFKILKSHGSHNFIMLKVEIKMKWKLWVNRCFFLFCPAKLPVTYFTPEGVVFVVQWALLAVLGYWLLSLAVCLIAGVVRRTLFLLKVIVAVAVFGLIVSDGGASAETTAMRLAGLVLACVLLGVGPSYFRGDTNAHLEQKVKLLEKRLRDLERKRKEEWEPQKFNKWFIVKGTGILNLLLLNWMLARHWLRSVLVFLSVAPDMKWLTC